MPNEKISAMPAATLPLAGIELVPLVQGSTNVQTAVSNILAKASTNIFLSAQPNIDKTGLTDSTVGVLAALALVAGTNNTLVWDCPCYCAIGTDLTKTIFIAGNTNIDFTSSGAFITDALGVPAIGIVGVSASNCTFTDFTLRYIGNPGATMLQYVGTWAANNGNWNTVTLTNYMTASNGNTFTGGATAIWPGPTNTCGLIYIGGGVTNINFVGNCSATAVYSTADRFIPCLFSLNTQWVFGITVPSGLAVNSTTAAQPTNISFDSFTVDGVCMAWVGTGANLKMRNITRFRYGDLEDSSGNNQGGIGTVSGRSGNLATDLWFAPPHLFYLQSTSASFVCSVDYLNILDEGIYTSNNLNYGSRRTGLSGYINSMKIDASALNTVKNYITKSPDGFCDVLAQVGGSITPGCTIENVDIYLDCGVGGTWMNCSGAAAGATSFTVAPANWVCNQSGGSYVGWNTGTYPTTFSTGEIRAVTYTVTVVGNSATAINAAWTKPLLNTNTTLIRVGGPNAGRFAFRYPSTPAQNLFLKNIKIIDLATFPYTWPLQSDAATGHINVFMDAQVIVNDVPTICTYYPGFGLTGEGINIHVKQILANHSQTQNLRGPIANVTGVTTTDFYHEVELHGWRQVAITFASAPSGTGTNLAADQYHTGDTGWIWPSGTCNVLFSDNEIRAVTFTNGSVTTSWTGALTGAPSVTAIACLLNFANFNSFKPRIQVALAVGNIVTYGVRAKVLDMSNGATFDLNQGKMTETWEQFFQGLPSGSTGITYDTTWAIDQPTWGVTSALSGGTATNVNINTGGTTLLANAPIASPGAVPALAPQVYAGVITVAAVSGSLPTAGTAYVGVRGTRVKIGDGT